MTADDDDSEVRRELDRVEELIASMRRDHERATNTEGTPDAADAGRDLTDAAEYDAVLESLEARRDRLRSRLGRA